MPSAAERADGTKVYAETLRALTAFDHDLAVEAAEDLGRAYRRRYQASPAREEVDPRLRPGAHDGAPSLGGQAGNGIRPGQADAGSQIGPGPTGREADESGAPDPSGKTGKRRPRRRKGNGPER